MPDQDMLPIERSMTILTPPAKGHVALLPYVTRLWQRRSYIYRAATANLRARNYNTIFGKLWNILDPLILAAVYVILLTIIRSGRQDTSQLVATTLLGLLFFQYCRNSIDRGARSVLTGHSLIMNSSVPRASLPTASVVGALITFIPMIPVYLAFHIGLGRPVNGALFFLVVVLFLLTPLNLGVAMGLAALTVHFRDIGHSIPYILRILLYITPILYRVEEIPTGMKPLLLSNPLYPTFASLQAISQGRVPDTNLLLAAGAWGALLLTLGSWIFISRERTFALHL